MDGIIIVNKPPGWTSFDVVAKIRNLSQTKKVGHSGTLDPMATGVLAIFLGTATKSVNHFMVGDKGYLAEMTLGVRTDTLDADGESQSSNIKDQNNSQFPMSNSQIEAILPKYTGEIEQVPPMYSAIKIKGKRLYKLARQGIEVKREPRKITIHSLKLLRYGDGEHPKATLELYCSKGTYVRQLVSDLGDDLGCGAHLSKLERTYSKPFHISQALTMEAIITLAKVGKLHTVVIPVESVLNKIS
ncbi:tRNA pseudouridine(55) synthase TruB [candidate division WOR-1 bacterium RIFOXYB2_FULL_42_35]|uniref:tRNA pseudouridine synthase B n=1 Tax=candidate division WOR-1 bacterium RIFOXYC2_FULL_41_25 TaxID=1802586 RepID=A0A1F4TIY9_UNCSA|nr:MAG: tRNA pseudouridine(55) synthase TruB [candidate division WOR-1 bacterium RIFOXYA2_FULL_41_14]OGC24068.1 MAG: tRNA pseudouridine(55) synthase TruB [candidate division WOR-1 bacterium RIFOXYB2_FULL_42_35]OGC32490.1 MAG: tRNA pseudouridine(55) synthase TruB [candidate division WOR-1 bacterium RIFOXYC2_FULL_41_25]OGC42326.1 MAG: tRNA pseudouridine(55) synthase TruB [candidate division WOR-1 bacterium RIFOXYD2_FULL_41_8]